MVVACSTGDDMYDKESDTAPGGGRPERAKHRNGPEKPADHHPWPLFQAPPRVPSNMGAVSPGQRPIGVMSEEEVTASTSTCPGSCAHVWPSGITTGPIRELIDGRSVSRPGR